MSGLVAREGLPWRSHDQAVKEVGGMWAIPHWRMSSLELKRRHHEFLAEARQRNVRAIETEIVDDALVEALPDLEFLQATGIPDGSVISRLRQLRSLGVATWKGHLDFADLPRLEWLGIAECEPGNLDSLVPGHPSLRHLIVGRYPFADLGPLGRLRLRRLSIGNGRRLTSLAGAAALAPALLGLDLWMLPALTSLDGIEALTNVEALILSGLRRITTLDWVEQLPRLRLLVADLKNVESLRPVTGHPSLEFVIFRRTRDLDLAPLRSLPHLRLISGAPGPWNRELEALPELRKRPPDDPDVFEMRRLWHG